MICMAAHHVVVPCDQSAPFGWPVVPDVYMSMAGVSGSGSGTGVGRDADPIAGRDAEIKEHVRMAMGSLRQFLMAEKIPAVEGQRRVLRQEPCGISERLACEE